MRLWACLTLSLTACATGGARAQTEPPPFEQPSATSGTAPSDPASAPAPAGDPGAEADFQAAVAKFRAGDRQGAVAPLEAFLARHPQHPFRGTAAALLGRIALGRGDARAAKTLLERGGGNDEPAVRFVLGLSEARLGNHARALELLGPFAGSGPPSMGGTADDEADLALRASLADAYAGTNQPARALDEWEHYGRSPRAQEHERAYARRRAEEIAARLPADAALEAYRATESAFARAALGPRAAGALRARGDVDGAKRLEEETSSTRRSQAFDRAMPWVGPGDPTRLGLAVPLSGHERALGEVVLRGAMLAIGESASAPGLAPFQILLRDAAAGTRTMSELTREEAVIGIVGRPDRGAIDETTRDGVPFLVLDDRPPGGGTSAFQLLHAPEARAGALARRALALGVRRFGIMAPDSPSGQRLAEAFKTAVQTGGGKIVGQVTYVARSRSLTATVAQLRRANPDAVFVPDEATELEFIAPALAAGDLFPSPYTEPSRRPAGSKRREVLLLSTAVGLSGQLLKRAGRYVQGALLAPGFYAADDDPRLGGFVTRFREIYGQDPSATDAYGFDGVRLLRAAVERGARTRADVLRLLTTESFEGVTGALRFGPDHGRIDPPLVYAVQGETIRAFR